MVFLDVHDTIWSYLKENDILDDIIDEFEDFFGGKVLDEYDGTPLFADLVLEFGLFYFFVEKIRLLEYLKEHLFKALPEKEQEAFTEISKSKRHDLTYLKKEKKGKLDTYGRDLYDVYFQDNKTGETKIIVSSSNLTANGKKVNARLMRHPLYEGSFLIIGLVYGEKGRGAIESLEEYATMRKNYGRLSSRKDELFSLSKTLTLDEIESYEEKNSPFPEQDRKIMKANKLFYGKFSMNLDEFANNGFALSNDKAAFAAMAQFYLSDIKEFTNALFDTDYALNMKLFGYPPFLKSFLGFITEDTAMLEEGIHELRAESKKAFEEDKLNAMNMSREQIILNQKKAVETTAQDLRKEGQPKLAEEYLGFLNETENLTADEIGTFLRKLRRFIEQKRHVLDSDEDSIMAYIMFLQELERESENLPYLRSVEGEYRNIVYDPEHFYDFLTGMDEAFYNLMKVMNASLLFHKQDYQRAYQLVKGMKAGNTGCYQELFFVGKALSLFEDDEAKSYFKKAKKIDKARYKGELEEFLRNKEGLRRMFLTPP